MFGRFEDFVFGACLLQIFSALFPFDCEIRLKQGDHYFYTVMDRMIRFLNRCFARTRT